MVSETTRLVRGVAKLRGAARAMDLRKIHQMSSDLASGRIFFPHTLRIQVCPKRLGFPLPRDGIKTY